MHRLESKCVGLLDLDFWKVDAYMHFLLSYFIASSLARLLTYLTYKRITVSLVDLDGGVLIINYSMTARVVDNGEVIEDTKELRKRLYLLLQNKGIGRVSAFSHSLLSTFIGARARGGLGWGYFTLRV